MPFVTHPGLPGKVYVPAQPACARKHPCPDCHYCQGCGENRCRLCRAQAQVRSTTPAPPEQPGATQEDRSLKA